MTGQPPDLAQIEAALWQAAHIVERFGEAYLPIMERLEREYSDALKRGNARDRARRIMQSLAGAPGDRPILGYHQP